MEKDILVILMVAFGLFAIAMFIMFFIYLKKYYNTKHLEDDYKKDVDEKINEEENAEATPIPSEVVTPPIPSAYQDNTLNNNSVMVNEIVPGALNDIKEEEPESDEEMDFIPIKKK